MKIQNPEKTKLPRENQNAQYYKGSTSNFLDGPEDISILEETATDENKVTHPRKETTAGY